MRRGLEDGMGEEGEGFQYQGLDCRGCIFCAFVSSSFFFIDFSFVFAMTWTAFCERERESETTLPAYCIPAGHSEWTSEYGGLDSFFPFSALAHFFPGSTGLDGMGRSG